MERAQAFVADLPGEAGRVKGEGAVEGDAPVLVARLVDALDDVARPLGRLEPAPAQLREVRELGDAFDARGGDAAGGLVERGAEAVLEINGHGAGRRGVA